MNVVTHPKTVLILEDDMALNRAVVFNLNQEGHEDIAEEYGISDFLVKSEYDLNTLERKVLSYA